MVTCFFFFCISSLNVQPVLLELYMSPMSLRSPTVCHYIPYTWLSLPKFNVISASYISFRLSILYKRRRALVVYTHTTKKVYAI